MTRIAEVIDRIAAATSAIRTRREDGERLERHSGEATELMERMEANTADLRRIAERLESVLATSQARVR